jgi:Flp pilus assembly protein TadG
MNPQSAIKLLPAHRQGGVVAVEFALVMFVLLLIGAGIVEFGRAFWYYDAMAKGTRDAARYLSTVPTATLGSVAAHAQARVVNAATAGGVPDFANSHVSISCEPIACAAAVLPTDIASVTVSVRYPMSIGALFPFIASASSGGVTYAVTLAPYTTMPYMW